ncbi:Ig-like domain-containing protein [Aquipseudomonas alcaligenes]|uniref:Ig-like domain-containing protein n=1 Tax=Aquipseudomonas alcaligenes TaxID=43263 RepID=UPI0011B421AB|nr:Ig-like domain-containing protein [Pseudomonas alcaligenes]
MKSKINCFSFGCIVATMAVQIHAASEVHLVLKKDPLIPKDDWVRESIRYFRNGAPTPPGGGGAGGQSSFTLEVSPVGASTTISNPTVTANFARPEFVGAVRFVRDLTEICSVSATPFECADTVSLVEGTGTDYYVTAKFTDNSENTKRISYSFPFNDPILTASFTPESASSSTTNISVSAAATDPSGIQSLVFYEDGAELCSTSNTSFTCNALLNLAEGQQKTISVVATDAVGRASTAEKIYALSLTPPTVSGTVMPAVASTLSSAPEIRASASDSSGIERVEFYRDSNLICTDFVPPYACTDNVTLSEGGAAEYIVRAFDRASQSSDASVIYELPYTNPSLSLSTTPPQASTLISNLELNAVASDLSGINRVEFFKGGSLICTDTTSSYSCSDTATLVEGQGVTYSAIAYDNVGKSTTKSLSYNLPFGDPALSLSISPSQASTATSTPRVTANASDMSGIDRVVFYRAGNLICTDNVGPYQCDDIVTLAEGASVTYDVTAYDRVGRSKASTISYVLPFGDPTLSLSISPSQASTATSTPRVTANASDMSGIDRVVFYRAGNLICTDSADPYQCDDIVTLAEGASVTYDVTAYDRVGRSKASAISYSRPYVNYDPSVAVSSVSPNPMTRRVENVAVSATASDSNGINRVVFSSGAATCTDYTSPYSCTLSLTVNEGSSTTVTATAHDNTGKSASASTTVTGAAGELPTVSVSISPSTVSSANSSVTVTATASDTTSGIQKVDIKKAGSVVCSSTTSCSQSVTITEGQSVSYTAVATDNSGRTKESSSATLSFPAQNPTATLTRVSGTTYRCTGSDNDRIASFAFMQNGGLVGGPYTATGNTRTYIYSGTSFTAQCFVADPGGRTGTSNLVTHP